MFPALNLPQFDYQLKKIQGRPHIFDILRKKYLLITPEEWVRQHFIHYLINKHQYPKSLMSSEDGLLYNKRLKRTDILIYDRMGNPFMVIECKATTIKIDNTVFQQVATYNSTIKAPYICVTNGLQHFVCAIDHDKRSSTFLDSFPSFE